MVTTGWWERGRRRVITYYLYMPRERQRDIHNIYKIHKQKAKTEVIF